MKAQNVLTGLFLAATGRFTADADHAVVLDLIEARLAAIVYPNVKLVNA